MTPHGLIRTATCRPQQTFQPHNYQGSQCGHQGRQQERVGHKTRTGVAGSPGWGRGQVPSPSLSTWSHPNALPSLLGTRWIPLPTPHRVTPHAGLLPLSLLDLRQWGSQARFLLVRTRMQTCPTKCRNPQKPHSSLDQFPHFQPSLVKWHLEEEVRHWSSSTGWSAVAAAIATEP